ncbi:hypothetical protein COS31_01010 [Candidatus Roizmanbacteria bacterium CG02_land_8_20_14_3_00_36_15]|uniref:Uncharacterized protein n=2 Tax=Candidatus Roizmaniibacteriota TaxID=1752723 RepID=A0A2M8KLE2_9BACT|nr:MAG: hypothetical protein COS51_03980 [Candidatus Roizmanbacteria bacterium CG03_land_8_20_14_0_80_36_21]PIV38138.1 MAG: hypothetical protein COS31_01010 [Candidatus Roizmanbacteria bacterium CG02_land_8_20_14_3_00_36_15]PIY70309.1 MAG: hypothetical protein COY89_01815 [Candidatus Roizmanbacteria bacterium CG_4_10_14_0_8_um_filter_36_36]PJA53276.1 MAG: hypothetical protein CO166_02425 [Candidatus Roizmanbacteria bacterium CG_4_9_14_3_um_filter_36_11]PJC82124.1 MAG: hypothetical protein CO007
MKIFHKDLVKRWNKFSILEQMANIGAEVGRAINWKKKHRAEMSKNAFYRALELIDFTVDDPKNKNSLKEILRVREMLVDYFFGDNIYHSTDNQWEKYFYYFNFAARIKK